MNEKEAMNYIDSLSSIGIVPGLDNIRELCNRLGNPQDDLKFVHVAGTNGKGSVCSFLATALKCNGYRVGRYISPVLFRYRERIQVNGKCITKEALCRLIGQIREVCDEMVSEGLSQPTPFEVETALGFLYFREKACDIVILEAGMGGLLDATNIIKTPLAAVLTSISMDHRMFLGSSLDKIAKQKAGIIKSGCYVVSAPQLEEVEEVLLNVAVKRACPLQIVKSADVRRIRSSLEKQRFDYRDRKDLEITLAGRYQIENAALALDVLDILHRCGFRLSEEKTRKGLAETKWIGRFTVIRKKPYFIVDGAHNEDAAKRLAESIEFYFTNKRIIYIMGVLKDKDYEKIIALTHSLADQIITVTPPNQNRALPAYDLACEIAKVHQNVTAVDSLEEAVEMSRLLAGKEDCIIAFGSLSFLGRLIEIVDAHGWK